MKRILIVTAMTVLSLPVTANAATSEDLFGHDTATEQPADTTSVVYPTGQMPRDSSLPATIDKVNFLDDATIAHRKSIGNLYDTKVDKDVFEADQARQDKAQANTQNMAMQAHAIASEANENTGILMNDVADLKESKADKADVQGINDTVAANRKRADAQASSLKGEINQKVDGDVYIRHTASETADRADLRDQTQKLWADKASNANVDEIRTANAQESEERIAGDADLDNRKADKTALADETQARQRLAERTQKELNTKVNVGAYQAQLDADHAATAKAQGTADTANAKADTNTADIATVGAQTQINTQNIATLNDDLGRQAAAGRDYTDQQVGQVRQELGDVRKQQDKDREEYRGGLSALAAMANIPAVPGKTFDVGVGLGNFANSTSVALGMHYRPSENDVFKLSAASSNTGKGVVGMGFSHGF